MSILVVCFWTGLSLSVDGHQNNRKTLKEHRGNASSGRKIGGGAVGRQKRQIMLSFPGPNKSATSYDDLGQFNETDVCCRAHDSCPEVITPFHAKYGLFNFALVTKSLCSCDNELYSCLKNASNPIANTIGYLYFNVASPNCIDQVYRQVCTRRDYLWRCLKYEDDTTKDKVWTFRLNDRVY